MDKNQNADKENIVELIGEDGTPVLFEHLMTLEHGERTYVLLTPVEPETPDEEGMVVVLRIEEENGEDCYVLEENETLSEAVFERFLSIVEQEDEEGEDE